MRVDCVGDRYDELQTTWEGRWNLPVRRLIFYSCFSRPRANRVFTSGCNRSSQGFYTTAPT